MQSLPEMLAKAIDHANNGRLEEAESIYREMIEAEPAHAEARFSLGMIAFRRGEMQRAIEEIGRALQLRPNWSEAVYRMGTAYHTMGRLQEAVDCYSRALDLQPSFASARNELGVALYQLGNLDEAVYSFREALRIEPKHIEALSNLSTALRDQMQVSEAITYARRALALNPNYASAHFNLGLALFDVRELHESGVHYRRAIELCPHHAKAPTTLAMLLLLTGCFERGWVEYEWRWRSGQLPVKEYEKPRWNGEAVEGKTVLVWAEQGLGDTIQFVRYLEMVKERGARVVFECQRALVRLLASYEGIDELVPEGDALPAFDFQVPMLSLALVFATRVESIPATVPYLMANPALVAEWREKLQDINGFRVGINWRGRAGKRESRQLDIPVVLFSSLAQIPGVQLITLQKAPEGELIAHTPEPRIIELGDLDVEHGAFMDTAAIMTNLDLVITSDTSVAHLAGALGVPAWVTLQFVPDWRWLLERSDNLWYPTMRLFRQKKLGDWAAVFEEIEAELRDLARRR